MIAPTKKRLTIIFTSVVLFFNILILCISYFFLHHSIMSEAKRYMMEDIRYEFLDQYNRSGLDPIKNLWDEHYFQILNREGKVVVSTRNSSGFYPELSTDLFNRALAGKKGVEFQKINGENHMIAYFQLDNRYIGRAAMSMDQSEKYERNFLKLMMIALPGMFLLSFFISRLLVSRAMDRISDFFTFQETFSSNVTHELRSPLASLKGNIEVTLRKDRSVEDYKETLSLSLKEVDRIISLLNNLFMLASSKFKPLDLFKNKADIVSISRDVLDAYAPAMASRGIRYSVSTPKEALCLCDETLIRRTIENIIDNAVKYTPDNGAITLNIDRDIRKLSITLTNTCRGIDPEEISHIFDPFYRGRHGRSRDIEGKGLGLYIARYIVRSHGGEIKVNNTYGNIFSLTLTIPLK